MVDDWNSLSAAQCVNSCNINAFKKHSSVQSEPESNCHHGLRGSASPVLTATAFVNGRWQFSTPPTESTPLDRSPKNLVQVITSAAPMATPNLVQIRRWGLLGKWVKYNEFFFYLYLFFINSPTGQTRRRIFTLDGSNDADSRKDVPFWGFR